MANEDAGSGNTLSLRFSSHFHNNIGNNFKSFERDFLRKKSTNAKLLTLFHSSVCLPSTNCSRDDKVSTLDDGNLEVFCQWKMWTLFHRTKFNFRTKTIIDLPKCDNFHNFNLWYEVHEQHEYAFRIVWSSPVIRSQISNRKWEVDIEERKLIV